MRRPAGKTISALIGALLAAGCSDMDTPELPKVSMPEVKLPKLNWPRLGPAKQPEGPPPPLAEGDLPAPQTGQPVERVAIATSSEDVPAIYMALDPRPGLPVGVIFAIDASNDQTPDDEPAIRIDPEQGQCNPSELRSYRFPDADRRPVFSRIEAVRGVSPAELPAYLATQVSARMIDRGIAPNLEATKPQNVCTAKLWRGLVLTSNEAANRPASAAGQ